MAISTFPSSVPEQPLVPGAAEPVEDARARQTIRKTAAKVLRSDDLGSGEKLTAVEMLRIHPNFGNPHVVRCAWCRETRIFFRDEQDRTFVLTHRGWRCLVCDEEGASQEIKF